VSAAIALIGVCPELDWQRYTHPSDVSATTVLVALWSVGGVSQGATALQAVYLPQR
jgi:hypothetical protein